MAADFPASIPVIVRVLPTDMMDGAGTEADVLHNDLADEVEALATVIGVTGSIVPTTVEARITALQGSSTPETASTIGTLIAGSSDKATPVDADSIAISDSAAAGILKRLSWANVKAALNSLYARLAGAAGGQTITGGTAAGENLTLLSTSNATKGAVIFGTSSEYDHANERLGVGTLTPGAKLHALATTEQLRLGYDASNYLSASVSSTGEATVTTTGGTVNFQGTTATDGPTLGSELLTTAGWTVTAGWTESPDDVFAHSNGGGTAALSHSAAIASATRYQISWTVTGRTLGSFTVAAGGQSLAAVTATGAFGPTTTSTAGLTITPTNDFDGTISVASLKSITATSKAVIVGKTSGVSTSFEARFPSALSSSGVGTNVFRYLTTGINNSSFGAGSGSSLTSGYNNTLLGKDAGLALTVGYANVLAGASSGSSLTTGFNNVSLGQLSLSANVTGQSIVCAGLNSLLSYTGAGSVVAIGANAGRHLADGSTAFAGGSASQNVYIGTSARAFNDSDNNAVVIGGISAIGTGSNTTVIGTSATTAATLFGASTFSLTNATTNAAVTVGTLTKNVTGAGVGAAGLGPRLIFAAESSTTVDTQQADITATWTDATHATRKSRLALSASDSAAAREGMRIEADGSVAKVGFFGATAVVKPAALTATVAAAPAGGTGSAAGSWDTSGNRDAAIACINNLKTRVDQLESKLQALGLLT